MAAVTNDDRPPVNSSAEERSALARAMELTSVVTTIALQMALPPLGGYWLDQWLHTKALFVILGAAIGLVSGMYSLIHLAGRLGGWPSDARGRKGKKGDDR